MSAHPVIAACIGAIVLLVFATLSWKKRRSDLAEALATKNALQLCDAIVHDHAAELTLRRRQLTTVGSDGRVDQFKWLEERDLFIDEIIEPQVGDITNSLERLLAVWQMIDDATAEFAASRFTEPPVHPAVTGDRTRTPSTTAADVRAA